MKLLAACVALRTDSLEASAKSPNRLPLLLVLLFLLLLLLLLPDAALALALRSTTESS
jgi:hypothetical protein